MTTRIGLILATVLSLLDIATLAITDGDHPPVAIAATDALLGVVTLVGVVLAWRNGRRRGLRTVIAARALSVLTIIPAFVAGGTPAGVLVAASIAVLLGVVTVLLLFTSPTPADTSRP